MTRDSSRRRYRLVSAPDEAFTPQVGWLYEQRGMGAAVVKLRAIQTASGKAITQTIFEVEVPLWMLDQHYEEVA